MQNVPAFTPPIMASIALLAISGAGPGALAQTAPAVEPAAPQAQFQARGGRGANAGGFQGGARQGGVRGQAGQAAGAGGFAPPQAPAGQAQNAQAQNGQAQFGAAQQARAGQAPGAAGQAVGGRGQPAGQRGQAFGAQQFGGPGRGAPAAAAVTTSDDPVAQAFRAEASAVTGAPGHMQVLLVQNLGWMRSTRTLAVGGEYKEGWILSSLDAGRAVLHKAGSPDKQIDLSRWSGPVAAPARGRGAPGGAQATQISMGSLGMSKGASGAAQGAAPAANRAGGANAAGQNAAAPNAAAQNAATAAAAADAAAAAAGRGGGRQGGPAQAVQFQGAQFQGGRGGAQNVQDLAAALLALPVAAPGQ